MVSFYSLGAAFVLGVFSVQAAPAPAPVPEAQTGVPPPDIHWWCYDGGRGWEGKDAVLQHVRNACFGWSGNRGYYQDVYYKPWSQSPYPNNLCVNTGGSHINLQIWNYNEAGLVLRNQDCYNEFAYLVNDCPKGGEIRRNSNWKFRIDPNDGHC